MSKGGTKVFMRLLLSSKNPNLTEDEFEQSMIMLGMGHVFKGDSEVKQ
jgi:hypothetical protein